MSKFSNSIKVFSRSARQYLYLWRGARYYKLTRAGSKQLEKETRNWQQTTDILARFLDDSKEGAR